MMNLIFNDGLNYLKYQQNRWFRYDLLAAVVVFLVAVPLCLGIALASGAPMVSGLISGVIGGIVVGALSRSPTNVSGPAAGMAALVLGGIAELGGFDMFLVALIIAGMLQMLAGWLRAGFIAEYIPSHIVQGLLSAVGILLMIKELPFAFNSNLSIPDLKYQLNELSSGLTLAPLQHLLNHLNVGASLLSVGSFLILLSLEKNKWIQLKHLPASFIVLLLGIGLNGLFLMTNSSLAQIGPNLVNLPQHDGLMDFISQTQFPNWSALYNPNTYVFAVLLSAVGLLENLLNLKAAEKLDKKHRNYSKDRDLVGQGIANMLAGLIGGIPITSVIVRTSVNIQAGSKTKIATILHGLMILLVVMFIPNALNKIPLSSLAAVLIYTGYKLTTPSIYVNIYKQGWDRFIPFMATVVGILILNVLLGILFGLLVSLFFILKSNSLINLHNIKEIYPKGVINRLVLPQQTTFLNKAAVVAELEAIPEHSELIIDARASDYIDKEVIEFIKEFQQDIAPGKNISLNLIGFKDDYHIHNFIDFINVTTYDVQSNLHPYQVLNLLREGNQRFLNDTCIHRNFVTDIEQTAANQHPFAVVLGCIDSRVPVETVFDMSFGDLFCVRVAGNVVNDDVLASIEYACNVVGAKLIVVLGHTRCGAIQAACNGVEQGHITQLLSKIKPAIAAETHVKEERTGHNSHFVNNVTHLNIANTLARIYEKSALLKSIIDSGQTGIVGALYEVDTGRVLFKDFSDFLHELPTTFDQEMLGTKLKQVFEEAN